MKINRLMGQVLPVFFLVLLAVSTVHGQVARDRLEAIRARMAELNEFFDNLSEDERKALSGSAHNLRQVAKKWGEIEKMLEGGESRMQRVRGLRARNGWWRRGADLDSSLTSVSDPSTDFDFSVMTGFTQSETSTAWCGNNVVVGFNDSGSLPESIFFGPGGTSFNGVARSSDRGRSFADLGFLNPGPDFLDGLFGDPVVACTDEHTFYYASLFDTSEVVGGIRRFLSAISLSKSTDGGLTFGDPVAAVKKSSPTHFLDKDWMTADPANPNRIYVTYTDFDASGGRDSLVAADCPAGRARGAIELVRSMDGGMTWSQPLIIAEVCTPDFVQASQVAVGPMGEVYVLWGNFQAGFFGPRELRIRRSDSAGQGFGPTVKVADVIPVGDGFALQANFRNFLSGSLAVDRSGGPTRGHVYVAWEDGRNLQVPDFSALPLDYGYADILLSRSNTGGMTWSMPLRVNRSKEPLDDGRGTDQFQPGVAVDPTGKVAVCFYDRQDDERNFLVGRSCVVSGNAGATWKPKEVTDETFVPIHATDSFINTVYMGDYDVLASDATRRNLGFVGGFQFISGKSFVPNPDIKVNRIPVDRDHDD